MPCLVCGGQSSAHHLRHDGRKGISKDHRLVVPLCPTDHQYGRHAIHVIGHPAFEVMHGLDLMAEATRLWDESRNLELRKAA